MSYALLDRKADNGMLELCGSISGIKIDGSTVTFPRPATQYSQILMFGSQGDSEGAGNFGVAFTPGQTRLAFEAQWTTTDANKSTIFFPCYSLTWAADMKSVSFAYIACRYARIATSGTASTANNESVGKAFKRTRVYGEVLPT